MIWSTIDSPVGELLLTAEGGALTRLAFSPCTAPPSPATPQTAASPDDPDALLLRRAHEQLTEYFAGRRRDFDLPLAPRGTDFQQRVWQQLRLIEYGSTASYGDIARALGLSPGASRAVGAANGANPIAIMIGCHRVIGADGTLTGFAGGLPRKRYLLQMEQQQENADTLFALPR